MSEEVEANAHLLIAEVKRALANNCLHYDPETKELLSDPKAILTCLRDKGSVVVQEPRRCRCGHREHGNDPSICPVCKTEIPGRTA